MRYFFFLKGAHLYLAPFCPVLPCFSLPRPLQFLFTDLKRQPALGHATFGIGLTCSLEILDPRLLQLSRRSGAGGS